MGIALVSKNVGDGCMAFPQLDDGNYIDLPYPVNMSCYISSFNPKHPEQNNDYQNNISPIDYVTASGTVSGTSLSTVENL